MPRTLDPILEAALENGTGEVYFRANLILSGVTTWVLDEITKYKLTADEMYIRAVYNVQTQGGDYDQLDEITLERGLKINGTEYGVTTSKFKVTSAKHNENFLEINAELLGIEKFSTAGDVSWTSMLTSFFSNYGFTISHKNASEAYWSNQVLPSGKMFSVNKGKQIKTFMKQKAFMSFADNGGQDVSIFAVKDRPYLETPEYNIELEQELNVTDNQIIDTGFVGLLYRDEASTIYKPSGTYARYPLYNIGFLKTGDVLIAGTLETTNKTKYMPQLMDPIDVKMNLNYQTGDHVAIRGASEEFYKYGRLVVVEYFDKSKTIPWGLTLSLWDYIGGTEGGTMPSTIEAAAPYTPLNVSHFNGILSENDNNIQAAMETIDDHTHAGIGYTPPTTTAANDFQVGDGSGNWITKTLAQTITILRTSLDSIYAAITHAHAASDITSGTLGAARLPVPTTTTLGGVARNTGSAGEYVTGIDASGNLEYDTPAGGGSSDGWTAYSAVVPTRSASDDPTYTLQFAGVDLTGVLSEGMPIKWTQNSIVRYGWISSAPAFSTNTTITVLTRCNDASANYDVLDTGTYTISNFAYGLPKQPGYGFPVSPEKWTLEYSNTSDATQASPANGTWYNAGTQKLDVHIGSWRVMYQARLYAIRNGTQLGCVATLSTTNNGDTDTDFKTGVASVLTSFNQNYIFTMTAREKYLTLTTKITYYLNITSSGASEASIGVNGATSKTIIRAICSYL